MKNFIKGFLLSSLFVLSSCVGIVQDTNTAITDINSNFTPSISFAGIQIAKGISDSRVELFFYSAAGGSGKYIYDIYVANKPNPISVPSDILTPDYRGYLRYTVTELEPMRTFPFTIQVRDQVSNAMSTNVDIKPATTFSNLVADFDGIGSAANMPGQDGKDSVLIRYTPAKYVGNTIGSPLDNDPISYELVMIDADRLTPADMDRDLEELQGKWIFSWLHSKDNPKVEHIARGLLPNRKYYARLRAIHKGTQEDVHNPHKRGELNTKYVEINTLSDDLTDIQFDNSSFTLSIPTNSEGLTTFFANWGQVEGVFDHLRLYYAKNGAITGDLPDLCLSEAQSEPGVNIFCKNLHYAAVSSQVTGLDPYTKYQAVLVICQTSACTQLERRNSVLATIDTDPLTIFNGITKIETSTSLNGSETLKIYYENPSTIGGHFDGLILKMRRSEDESSPIQDITEISDPVFVFPFDPRISTQITVGGIDYITDEPYCFLLYPYKWNADRTLKRTFENSNWSCITPRVSAPDASSFPGLESGTSFREYVTLKWLPPTSGFYTHYVIFWKRGSDAFNWTLAKEAYAGEDNGYSHKFVDGSLSEITLPEVFANDLYTFGILTYFAYVTEDSSVEKWSDINNSTVRCSINNNSTLDIECNY